MMHYCTILFLIFFVGIAEAGVYQCRNPSGVIEFRDKPCNTTAESNDFLPIPYKRTNTNEKVIKKQDREIKLANQALEKQEKKSEKVKERTRKQQEKDRLKAERQLIRCQKLDEKISKIEAQLRQGCNMKRSNRLREQLVHCEAMKSRYCTSRHCNE